MKLTGPGFRPGRFSYALIPEEVFRLRGDQSPSRSAEAKLGGALSHP